jgi:multiple sugar transport system substrate-binding protein
MNTRSKRLLTLIVLTLLTVMAVAPAAAQEAVTIHVLSMAQAAMTTDEMDAIAAEFMEANPNVTVVMEYVAYDALHDKFTTAMATNPPPYDVIMVDVIWYDEFVNAGYLLDVTDRVTEEQRDGMFDSAWNVVTRNDTVYGLPWLIDTKYFFYNTDLLAQAGFDAPPATWEEMVSQGEAMKAAGLVEYPIVWSWAQAEAAICDFTALVYGNGGEFLDSDGNPAFNQPEGVAALQWMVDSVNNGISNPASISYLEEDVRNVFSSGRAAFAMNWLYMYDLANNNAEESQITGQVGITTVPVFESTADSGVATASVDGSSGFSIVSTSEHPDEAWAYIEYLTSEDTQMRYSLHQTPVWETAYEGDNLESLTSMTEAAPVIIPMLAEQFPYAHVRPTVPYYLEGSKELQLAMQLALTGQMTPQEALDQAAETWTELGADM